MMSEEFSIGKEAANFATAFIKTNAKDISGFAKDTFRAAANEVRVRMGSTYTAYLERVGERHSKVKTFLFNQEAVRLHSFYVPLGVATHRTRYPDVRISDLTETHNFNIITGTAGSGKSMMMRYLFLDSILEKKKIPVFFDLRELNDFNGSLVEAVKNRLRENKFDLGESFVDRALQLGYFILFLDGFDELAENKRGLIGREIIKLAKENDRNQIVVSSRPDNLFMEWEWFREWEIDELTLSKACAIIEKLPFDAELKSKFIKDLRKKLFAQHQYFLSNPLLLTIMWLCYGENAEIPQKYNLFYERAYEALFNKHDARKGGFRRNRKTQLDIKEFSDVFAALSIQSFDADKVEFSESEAVEFLNKSKKLTIDSFDPVDFLSDSMNAVCLLMEDGLRIRFSHKSFQEYFAALFVTSRTETVQKALFDRYLNSRSDTANLLKLAYGIRPESVEKYVLIPGIDALLDAIGFDGDITLEVFGTYVRKFLGHLQNDESGYSFSLMADNRGFVRLVSFVGECPELQSYERKLSVRKRKNSRAFLDELANLMPESESGLSAGKIFGSRRLLGFLRAATTVNLESLIELRRLLIIKHRDQRESLDTILGLD